MKVSSEYNRYRMTFTFATTAATSMDVTLSGTMAGISTPCLLKAAYLKTHAFVTAAAAASGASGGIVTILDGDSNTIKAFTEVATALSAFIISGSNDILLFPDYVVRYQISATRAEPRIVSGADRTLADVKNPTLILFTE